MNPSTRRTAILCALALPLVVAGVAMLSVPLGLIVAGGLLAAWSVLFILE